MKHTKSLWLALLFCIGTQYFIIAQNKGAFKNEKFPVNAISEKIIEKRNLKEKMEILSTCDWRNRQGKFIDIFWLQTEEGNFFGEVYEYFMDCDNLRLIYWYRNPSGKGKLVDFMIEDLEDESNFVVAKRKHLKNKKKYRHLLNQE